MTESAPSKTMTASTWWANIGSFLFTLTCAWTFQWQATDVIWGLWISSLTVGYCYILVAIVTSVVNAESAKRSTAIGSAAFLLVFFTFHFGFFHFVHSVFLNTFFPLHEEALSGAEFNNFFSTIQITVRDYWPLIIATLVSRWQDLPFNEDISMDKNGALMKPYANVVRIHILIFVFAGLYAAKLEHIALYPVLASYFIPWGIWLSSNSDQSKDT
jgi:hypothetical protein